MNRSTPGLLVHHQLLESTQTHVHWVGDAIQPSHPLSSPSPPAPNLFQHQGLFKWVIRCPKYWSFSFNISPSNEHPGLISFRMDWLDLLAVHMRLKIRNYWFPLLGLPRWHSGKDSACQCSRCRFDPWTGKILRRRKWQSAPVFLPGKSHGRRNLVDYSSWGCKESDTTEHTHNY